MQTAQGKNACRVAKFWWRRDVSTPGLTPPEAEKHCRLANNTTDHYELMTVNEIINGKVKKRQY